jgi:HEAT repeat protein
VDTEEIPHLVEKLRDDKERDYAVAALGRIGSPAVLALIEALKDKDRDVRISAAST